MYDESPLIPVNIVSGAQNVPPVLRIGAADAADLASLLTIQAHTGD